MPNVDLTAEEKVILDKNIQRLISQIQWIDQYNANNPPKKIYLYFTGGSTNEVLGCVLFASEIKLPVMWIEPKSYDSVYDCPTGFFSPQYSAVFNEEQNVFNNKLYPNLPKYYGVARGDIFIYAVDLMKKSGLTFSHIPMRGVGDYYIDPSKLRYISSFDEATSAFRYIRSIFTSADVKASYEDMRGKEYYEGYSDIHYVSQELYDRYISELQPPQN